MAQEVERQAKIIDDPVIAEYGNRLGQNLVRNSDAKAPFKAANVAIPFGFLKFSRAFESEADMLGLQYLYKTGYDPTVFVDFFEQLESLETKEPEAPSQVFASHPMTEDRIRAARQNIQDHLKTHVAAPSWNREHTRRRFGRPRPETRSG